MMLYNWSNKTLFGYSLTDGGEKIKQVLFKNASFFIQTV